MLINAGFEVCGVFFLIDIDTSLHWTVTVLFFSDTECT